MEPPRPQDGQAQGIGGTHRASAALPAPSAALRPPGIRTESGPETADPPARKSPSDHRPEVRPASCLRPIEGTLDIALLSGPPAPTSGSRASPSAPQRDAPCTREPPPAGPSVSRFCGPAPRTQPPGRPGPGRDETVPLSANTGIPPAGHLRRDAATRPQEPRSPDAPGAPASAVPTSPAGHVVPNAPGLAGKQEQRSPRPAGLVVQRSRERAGPRGPSSPPRDTALDPAPRPRTAERPLGPGGQSEPRNTSRDSTGTLAGTPRQLKVTPESSRAPARSEKPLDPQQGNPGDTGSRGPAPQKPPPTLDHPVTLTRPPPDPSPAGRDTAAGAPGAGVSRELAPLVAGSGGGPPGPPGRAAVPGGPDTSPRKKPTTGRVPGDRAPPSQAGGRAETGRPGARLQAAPSALLRTGPVKPGNRRAPAPRPPLPTGTGEAPGALRPPGRAPGQPDAAGPRPADRGPRGVCRRAAGSVPPTGSRGRLRAPTPDLPEAQAGRDPPDPGGCRAPENAGRRWGPWPLEPGKPASGADGRMHEARAASLPPTSRNPAPCRHTRPVCRHPWGPRRPGSRAGQIPPGGPTAEMAAGRRPPADRDRTLRQRRGRGRCAQLPPQKVLAAHGPGDGPGRSPAGPAACRNQPGRPPPLLGIPGRPGEGPPTERLRDRSDRKRSRAVTTRY
ncbi:basic proline-rich protein-like [Ornithorhynchus anatinus]|uniref:basic proline-rich protein-like n=1 Tax=Ornithorhynchus anatinus TaxID=9258 RepID=UPI0010A8C3A7|nr:basic proline-rich protein-like [Ornithorhynchus anatinus]